jgi:hypothetical protein
MKPCFPIMLLAGLASHGLAFGQILSFTTDFGSASSQISLATPVALDIAQFNSALGTLTNVTLSLDITGSTATPQVLNLSSSGPQAYTNAFTQMTVSLEGPDGTNPSIQFPESASFSGLTNPAQFSIANAGTTAFGSETSSINVVPGNLAFYEGVGSGNLTVDLSGNFFSQGTGTPNAVAFGGDGTAYGMVQVEYTYSSIPEPSAYAAVLGVAAFCIAALRRAKAITSC